MKMKRLLALLLAAAIPVSFLTACGDDTAAQGEESSVTSAAENAESGENGKNGGSGGSTAGMSDASEESAESAAEDMTMLDADSLTEEQERVFIEILFNAVQSFDFETLEKYTAADNDTVAVLKKISEDPVYKDLWDKTVGKMIFLPSYSVILAKSNTWLFSTWYMEKAEENAEIPDSASMLTLEEVNEFYDKYYDECPYIAGNINGYTLNPFNDEETGKLLFDIRDILSPVGFENITELNYLEAYSDLNYGTYLFGEQDSLDIGYDYIAQEDNLPQYKEFLSFDLDKIVETVENDENIDKNNSGVIYDSFKKYYVNEENRAIVKKWLEENCTALRDLSTVYYFYPADYDCDFPVYCLSDEDKAVAKELNVAGKQVFRWFPSDLENGCDMLNGFYELAEILISQGVLTEVDDADRASAR